jgi:hypothetical protein
VFEAVIKSPQKGIQDVWDFVQNLKKI